MAVYQRVGRLSCSRDGPLGLGLEVSWTFCSVKISCEKNESSICDALPEREAFWIIEPYVHTLLPNGLNVAYMANRTTPMTNLSFL